MFFVFNKDKIYSYIVAFSTVIVLFIMSLYVENDTVETSTNEIDESKNSIQSNYISTNNIIN